MFSLLSEQFEDDAAAMGPLDRQRKCITDNAITAHGGPGLAERGNI